MTRWSRITVGAIMVSCAPMMHADTVQLEPIRDNTLYESGAGDLSNGAGNHFFAGRNNQQQNRRGLLAFDIDASVPPGAVIQSVTLTLHLSQANPAPQDCTLHRLLADWGEGASQAGGGEGGGGPAQPGDATWLHTFYDNQFWSAPGGDFVSAPSATTSVEGDGFYSWTSQGLVADVQQWLDAPGSDFGWCLVGNESGGGTAKRFDSREIFKPELRPVLTITFTPPGPTGACCLPDGTCQDVAEFTCGVLGGDWQGGGTGCEPNRCFQPIGACCLADATCVQLSPIECNAAGGTYQGNDVPCEAGVCIAGACCFGDRSCLVLTPRGCADAGGEYQGDDITCAEVICPAVLEPFVDALPIPAVAQPTIGVPGGEATYDIALVEVEQQLHRDLPPTRLWTYGGTFPGPTIEATIDQPVTVNWHSDLRDERGALRKEHLLPVDLCPHGPDHHGPSPRTVVHLHGGHVPAVDDGYPEFTILPGETDPQTYPNHQLPATLWYHDHALGITRLNVMLGLAGFYLLRDDVEAALGLPDDEHEIPLVIQDRMFNPDGSLLYPAEVQDHFFGDTILVNGKVWPFLEVQRGKYRFRLLNGSNSRVYRLTLSNGQPFTQIGTDGGLLEQPLTVSELILSPSERIDVVIDFEAFAPGSEILLVNDAPAPFPGLPDVGVVPDVMKFIVVDEPGHTDDLPAQLREMEDLDEDDAVIEREFVLERFPEKCAGTWWLINGLVWDDITEFPVRDTTEVWTFINRSGLMHPMHLHLVQFQILDRQSFIVVDGEVLPVGVPFAPTPSERGWKDTVRANPFEITRVIARFEDYTGKFAYHCHILEHEDHEMMRQFRVILPCPSDLNGDRDVGPADLAILLDAWGPNPGHPADFTGNGVVNAADLAAILEDWGPCPLD